MQDEEMHLDIDYAYEVWLGLNPGGSKDRFLKELGMSWQTYKNYQNGKGEQTKFKYMKKIKDWLNISYDKLLKPKK